MKDFDIYAKHLFKLGKGYPLWQPEPTRYGEVQIGDVGFLDDGAFYRTCNVIKTDQGFATSTDPERLEVDRMSIHRRQEAILPGMLQMGMTLELHAGANV